MSDERRERRRDVPDREGVTDHGDEPIHWPEIDADARERPLRVRRRRRGRNVSDVEHFEPRRS